MSMAINEIQDRTPLLDGSYDTDRTRQMTLARQNQELPAVSGTVDIMAKALFCLTFPFSCFCSCLAPFDATVGNYDVIVERFGIPFQILRQPNVYLYNPVGLETHTVPTGVSTINLSQQLVNDSLGNPVVINAYCTYKVVDALLATYQVANYHHFLTDQARIIVRKIAAAYPYDSADATKNRLRNLSRNQLSIFTRELQATVNPIGLQIVRLQLGSVRYAASMEKAILAKQEANSYITARRAIAEGAVGIIGAILQERGQQGHELPPRDQRALATNLIYTIISPKQTTLALNMSQNPS